MASENYIGVGVGGGGAQWAENDDQEVLIIYFFNVYSPNLSVINLENAHYFFRLGSFIKKSIDIFIVDSACETMTNADKTKALITEVCV